MKTSLPTKISSIEEAKKFLTELNTNEEIFHPEDDATDLSGDLFTFEEGTKLNSLMEEIYELKGFDACEFILMLDEDYAKQMEQEEIPTKKGDKIVAMDSNSVQGTIPIKKGDVFTFIKSFWFNGEFWLKLKNEVGQVVECPDWLFYGSIVYCD